LQYGTVEEIWGKIETAVLDTENGLNICPKMWWILAGGHIIDFTLEDQEATMQEDVEVYQYDYNEEFEKNTNVNDDWEYENDISFTHGFTYNDDPAKENGWFFEWAYSVDGDTYYWSIRYIRIFSNGMMATDYYLDTGEFEDTDPTSALINLGQRFGASYLKVTGLGYSGGDEILTLLNNLTDGVYATVDALISSSVVKLRFTGNIVPSKLNYGTVNETFNDFALNNDTLNMVDILSTTLAVRKQYMNVANNGDISIGNIKIQSDDEATTINRVDVYESDEGRLPALNSNAINISLLSGDKDIYEAIYFNTIKDIFMLVRKIDLLIFSFPYSLNLLDKIVTAGNTFIINSVIDGTADNDYISKIQGWR